MVSNVEIPRFDNIPPLDINRVHYSEKYSDDVYEYRHITLPKEFAKYIPKNYLMSEQEWRKLGILQSPGWEHYIFHSPEPHVLLFRRPLNLTKQKTRVSIIQKNRGQKSYAELDCLTKAKDIGGGGDAEITALKCSKVALH